MKTNFKNLKISVKIGLFMVLLILVSLLNYVGVVYFLSIEKDDAAVIDASGRNRMLSQKTAYFCERLAKGQNVKNDLRNTIELLETSLHALKDGGIAPGIANDKVLPSTPASIMPNLKLAVDHWENFKRNARAILISPLVTDSVYIVKAVNDSTQTRRMSAKIANPVVTNALQFIEANALPMVTQFDTLTKHYVSESEIKQANLKTVLLILLLSSISIIGLALYTINRHVVGPVEEISITSYTLAQGDIVINTKYESNDEIGNAITNMHQLTKHLEEAAAFAELVGNGNLQAAFKPVSEKDKLGQALVNMRDKLDTIANEEKRRNWISKGLALFSDLIRNNKAGMKQLSDELIGSLALYMEANQGAIFQVNDSDQSDIHLELLSIYAWNKKRFVEKRIESREGITGQAWSEKKIIYIKEAPGNFVEITSGLGKATPRSFMAVPLLLNDEVFGVIELASFREYENFEREFVVKIAEIIASTLSSAKTNDRTVFLLEQSQQQTEELRAQEEEMKQNMEEMQATQEEIVRKEKEYLTIIKNLEQTIEKQKLQIANLHIKAEDEESRTDMEKILLKSGKGSLHSSEEIETVPMEASRPFWLPGEQLLQA